MRQVRRLLPRGGRRDRDSAGAGLGIGLAVVPYLFLRVTASIVSLSTISMKEYEI